jgi:S-adenosyl-L-methionine hydrolase (adenosine-forming)
MANPSSPSKPIITLLTDFGTHDYFVGAMKGVILSINSEVQIVDITHDIPPQDIEAAAFNLLACYKDFPDGTIHVAVVDPGVGSSRRAIVVQCANQLFVGPDNGLFSWICEREGKHKARHVTNEAFLREHISTTFHGRDVFAPISAHLSTGTSPDELGPLVLDMVSLDALGPKVTNDGIEGRIIHIDRFGNCITNLTADHFGGRLGVGASLNVNQQRVTGFREFFSQTKSHSDEKLFMILGSAGFIEIAAQNASAASILNVRRGDRVALARASKSIAGG